MADYNSADWAREVSEQSRIRLDKLHALAQAGKNPYQLTRYDVTHSSKQILGDSMRFRRRACPCPSRGA